MDRLNEWIVFAAGISLLATSILAAERTCREACE